MYGMTKSDKLFAYELTAWLLEAGFIQSQCQMSMYYKYEPDGSQIVVLSYADELTKWLLEAGYSITISEVYVL